MAFRLISIITIYLGFYVNISFSSHIMKSNNKDPRLTTEQCCDAYTQKAQGKQLFFRKPVSLGVTKLLTPDAEKAVK